MAEGLDIRFNHIVERIDWGESGATVHCSSGATFSCDAVICTVSLGVLKVSTAMSSLNSPHTLHIYAPYTWTGALHAKHSSISISLVHRVAYLGSSSFVYGLSMIAMHANAGAPPKHVLASPARA